MLKNKKLVICCDMDDTIEHLTQAWVDWLNNHYGTSVDYEDIKHWDMTRAFPTLTKDQIYGALSTPEFWSTVKPMEDAQEVLPRLISAGHTIYICTSTHYAIANEKFNRCLFKYFPFIDRHNIILTYNKQLIKCDILIDDGTHNIIGDYIGLLMDAPYNREFNEEDYPNIHRVYNWHQIETFISDIIGKS